MATEVEFEGSVGSGAACTDETRKAAAAEARREAEGKIIARKGRWWEGKGMKGERGQDVVEGKESEVRRRLKSLLEVLFSLFRVSPQPLLPFSFFMSAPTVFGINLGSSFASISIIGSKYSPARRKEGGS